MPSLRRLVSAPPQPPPRSAPEADDHMIRRPDILLVEDSKDDRDLFELAVLKSGLDVTLHVAIDASDAIARLKRMIASPDRRIPAVIVLDLALPGGPKGGTLLDLIRNTLASEPVAVVVWTGSHLASDRTQCESSGVDDFVIKPKTFAGLVEFVQSLPRFFSTAKTGAANRRVMP